MSEETNNDGTWSGLKKTIIGTLTTVIGGGGIWLSTTLFGGHSEDKEEPKTEVKQEEKPVEESKIVDKASVKREYVCIHCGRGFGRKIALAGHLRSHKVKK